MGIDTQEAIRSTLLKQLRTDLLGPSDESEVLRQDRVTRTGDTPLSRYLIGILYPSNSLVDPEDDDFANDGTDDGEDEAPEPGIVITGMPKMSSIGISFAIERQAKSIEIEFRYGLYAPQEERPNSDGKDSSDVSNKPAVLWHRTQVVERKVITPEAKLVGVADLPGGARGEWLVREEDECLIISVFLRNTNPTENGPDPPENCLYQSAITIRAVADNRGLFVNRAHRQSERTYDQDIESYRLLYRDKPEYAVGHGCATKWNTEGCGIDRAREVSTELLPSFTVTATEARGGVGLTGLVMQGLAEADSASEVEDALNPLLDEYKAWIADCRGEILTLPQQLQTTATEHLADCEEAHDRMTRGLKLIASDPLVFEAFKFSNKAMMLQRTKSVEALNYQKGKGRIYDQSPPSWRPFQIAFFLLNLEGIANPESENRSIVDLLWFPTGGGKTEAYLGLAAFTLGLRRLNHSQREREGYSGDGGVTVFMRYTLRLLTIQQFQRASSLICACEVLRTQDQVRLGKERFSIGLWVGGAATPNHIDQSPDPQRGIEPGALQALANFDPNNEPDEGNPVQLRSCPWCGEAMSHTDYRAIKETSHLQIRCPNEKCEFHGSANDLLSGIPAFVVDEDIYLRCPSLLIATMDKIARLPWDDRTKALFGHIDRLCERHTYLAQGVDYTGTCGTRHNGKAGFPATGAPQNVQRFLPPELIIQDELHLVNGPLGSLMGMYESAVDLLCSQAGARPKVVASTATIRRYRDQIRGLFDRDSRQFPPPGLIASNSFFAAESKDKPGRLYVGICSPGKSTKTSAIRILASLMHTAEQAKNSQAADDVDPYWTAVCYFNSLRELGGAIRLVDDDVDHRLKYLARLDKIPPRKIERRVELTSRIPAKEISRRLRDMEQPLGSGNALDVLFATNMISVGVDIQRFGLMYVNGQPKTSAEYIQASSRVGRQTPGIICVLYNWSRPRDLSHYERFETFHSMMYRHVEASSVTPYSSRARDRALHGIFIGLVRLLVPGMAGNSGARNFDASSAGVQSIRAYLLDRISRNDRDETQDASAQLQALVDGWVNLIALHGADVKYRAPGMVPMSAPRTWLMESAEEGGPMEFPRPTLNSLRDVEKTAGLYFKNFTRARGVKP